MVSLCSFSRTLSRTHMAPMPLVHFFIRDTSLSVSSSMSSSKRKECPEASEEDSTPVVVSAKQPKLIDPSIAEMDNDDILAQESDVACVAAAAAAGPIVREVLSLPHKHPHLQDAEIRWKHYVYKTTQETLSHIGSDYFDVYLDKVANGELDGHPLVIEVADAHIKSPEEMFSFFHFILGGKNHSFAHIHVLDRGGFGAPRAQSLFPLLHGPVCPIAFVERLCQLGGYFGLDSEKHHNFLMALQQRAPKECPATTVVEWGRNFADPVLMRRGMRSLIVAVQKKEVHLNDISSPTIRKLLPVMRTLTYHTDPAQTVLKHHEFHSPEREVLSLLIRVYDKAGGDTKMYVESEDEDESEEEDES
jgi:hypothetical protein